MSITDDAPRAVPSQPAAAPRRARLTAGGSPWTRLVAACAALLLAAALVMLTGWAATRQTRVTTYSVVGQPSGIALDVGAADVEIDGGGAASIEVRRTDRYAFSHPPVERRTVAGGVVRISSRCPAQILAGCRSAYRVTVPDNVAVTVQTGSGTVRMSGLRASAQVVTGSGAVAVDAFCGFSLRVTSGSGDVGARADCSPDDVELRSGSGDVRAVLPAGRYRIEAQSDSGERRVRGLTAADDAPFQVQALSASGDVDVEAGT
jgi:hypothetical protein